MLNYRQRVIARAVIQRTTKTRSDWQQRASAAQIDRYAAWQKEYYDSPARFVRDNFVWRRNEHPTPYQAEILDMLVKEHKVSGRGPHGLGKSAMASWINLWFALTRDGKDWKAPTTASSWGQLKNYLWPEIHKWSRRLRWSKIGRPAFNEGSELLKMALQLRTGQAFAVASNKPELIEGAHANHILYTYDEAKTIIAATFDASEGAFSGAGDDLPNEAFAVSFSTPGEPSGRFYEIQSRRAGYEDWAVRAVTLQEAITARRISEQWATARKKQWGGTSAVYINRVLGNFASSDADGVIPLSWVEAAVARWHEMIDNEEDLPPFSCVGVDVADTGEAQTVLAPRNGHVIRPLRYYSHAEPMETAGYVVALLNGEREAAKRRNITDFKGRAVVDVIGVGSGVVSRLRELDEPVIPFHAGTGTNQKDKTGELGFANLRAAGWWTLREMLDPASEVKICLPDDDLLIGDLTTPKWRMQSGGRIVIESKEQIALRIGRSTDSGDAVMQAFANVQYSEPRATGIR
jgi:hypothetical protein